MNSYPYLPKQKDALKYLGKDSTVSRVLYGGSAGGGKSLLGCMWQIERRLKYPGTVGLIGRQELKQLKLSTLATFFRCCASRGLRAGTHYKVNALDGFIRFVNPLTGQFDNDSSVILLKELKQQPSDPDFQSLGSFEITDYFVDEAGEVTRKAIDILSSRCRHLLTAFCSHCAAKGLNSGQCVAYDNDRPVKWMCPSCGETSAGIPAKGLMTCNPNKGWLYAEVYRPFSDGVLASDWAFVPALASDNPHLPQSYMDTLASLPEYDKQRLLYGNWEYDDEEGKMFDSQDIYAMWRPIDPSGEYYLTGDIARLGKDLTVLIVWRGFSIIRIFEMVRKDTAEVSAKIRELISEYGILLRNVVVDEDGIGGGVVDQIRCKGFHNGGAAMDKRYTNQKAECYYKLAEMVAANQITVAHHSPEFKTELTRQLEATKRHRPNAEGKLTVTPKETMIRVLGRSPDHADAVMMRMMWVVGGGTGRYVIGNTVVG